MTNRPTAAPSLPVLPVPDWEDPFEREARTVGLQLFAAIAVAGVPSKAAYDARLRWPWLNFPVVVGIGTAGSLAGMGVARAVDVLADRVRLPVRRASARFWSGYVAAFAIAALSFDVASSLLEGISFWRGSSRWA